MDRSHLVAHVLDHRSLPTEQNVDQVSSRYIKQSSDVNFSTQFSAFQILCELFEEKFGIVGWEDASVCAMVFG